jgi:hypothetical protein
MTLPSEFKLYAECSTGQLGDFARIAIAEHDRANKAETELARTKQILVDNLPSVATGVIELTIENRKLRRQLEFGRKTNKMLTERWLASVVSMIALTNENESLKGKIAQASKALTE